jgi:hypothetical protein
VTDKTRKQRPENVTERKNGEKLKKSLQTSKDQSFRYIRKALGHRNFSLSFLLTKFSHFESKKWKKERCFKREFCLSNINRMVFTFD